MADNVHEVVKLLAARMESHPEEFRIYDNSTLAIGGRWETWISQIRPFMNEAEHEMLFSTAKEAFLQRVHEEVLDELLNGEERRAQEKRERDLEMQRIMAQAQQNALQPGQYIQAQSLGALQTMGIGTQSPSQQLTISTAGQEALRITNNGIQLGGETLDEGMIKRMKKALGL